MKHMEFYPTGVVLSLVILLQAGTCHSLLGNPLPGESLVSLPWLDLMLWDRDISCSFPHCQSERSNVM